MRDFIIKKILLITIALSSSLAICAEQAPSSVEKDLEKGLEEKSRDSSRDPISIATASSSSEITHDSLEEGKYYLFEIERVKGIILGKLIKITASASGQDVDLLIEHTYNQDRVRTQTSFSIDFVYGIFEAEKNKLNS